MASPNNQHEWLLASFKKRSLIPSGVKEFTPLDDIDSALAKSLNQAFDSLIVSEPSRYNKSFSEFLTRTARDRITLGSFPDVSAFLASFEDSRAGRKDTQAAKKQAVNKLALPIVNLSRSPAFSVYDGDISKDDYDAGELIEDDKAIAVVSTMPVALSYSLWVVSEEKQSLGMVCMALAFWMRLYASHGKASFMTETRLGKTEIGIHCVLEAQKSISFSDLTAGTQDNRIFAAGLDLTVIADMPIASYVKEVAGRIQVGAAVSSDCGWRGVR